MKTVLRRPAIVVVVLSLFVLGTPAHPAAASPLRGQVASFVWDATSNQHQLCKFSTGCIRYGNIVRMWQSILWADGRIAPWEIDGEFGPNTHERTVHWQGQYVPGDFSGKVGPNTWGAASRKIFDLFQCPGDGFCYYYYVGSDHGLNIRQDNSGYWQFFNPRTLAWTNTDH